VRLTQLDGLRGLAAMIVVIHHTMLLSPGFAATYMGDGVIPPQWSPEWWLSATPLKLLTAGGEAVTVFFVLSGIVLTLPVLAKRDFDLWSYYPRRMVRLYLPAFAAIALAAVWILLVPRGDYPDFGPWAGRWYMADAGFGNFLSAADLLFGDYRVDNPLWSLRWEVVFSLLLPVFVGVAVLLRRWPFLSIAGVALLVLGGAYWGNPSLVYLPAFLAGAVIAASFATLRRRASAISSARFGSVIWAAVAVLALVALILFWLVRSPAEQDPGLRALTSTISSLGAVILVLVAAFWSPLVRLLNTRFFQWLGRISFSIYLVHAPIALAAVYWLGPRRWFLAMAIAIAASLLVAVLFTRFVEIPSHRLSKYVGEAIASRLRRAQHPAPRIAPSVSGPDSRSVGSERPAVTPEPEGVRG
jgi:peptidoglycan/LPS O-acetylase OafA/YrhL